MAYALVGSAGAMNAQTSANTSNTPAWGTGESRTANNLLILWCVGTGSVTLPSTPSGWSIAVQRAGSSNATSASIFYKIASGGDAAPTVGAVASTNLACMLAEFSGNATATVVDQTSTNSGSASPIVVTNSAADVSAGELLVSAVAWHFSTNTTETTFTDTMNNGASATTVGDSNTNDGHAGFGWGITTGNASADQDSAAVSPTTNMNGAAIALASFLLPGSGPVFIPHRMPLGA